MHQAECVGMIIFLEGPYYSPSCRKELEHTGHTCTSMDCNVLAMVITRKLVVEGQEAVCLTLAASLLLWEDGQLYNAALQFKYSS